MRAILLLLLVIGIALMLQFAVVGRINLLGGSADLILVVLAGWALQERVRLAWLWGLVAGVLVGNISAAPWFIYVVVYLSIIGMSRLLVRRIWQAPLLAMFVITFIGTLLSGMLTFLYRILFDITLLLGEVFIQVVLPNILLNLLLAIAVHPIMRDIASRIYPAEVI